MELDDLDAFIANIEDTAPVEVVDPGKHRCSECQSVLEEIDDIFVCPNCNIQANILQVEESDVIGVNEHGFFAHGQRAARKTKETDYGWAWTTDESIVIILNHQITALEKLNLVPEFFRDAVRNMWLKFWVDNIAPYIRDSYNDNDFIPAKTRKVLKYRDLEVLVKVNDRVLIPKHSRRIKRKRKHFVMAGTKFRPDDASNAYYELNEHNQNSNVETSGEDDQDAILDSESEAIRIAKPNRRKATSHSTSEVIDVKIGRGEISILTLDRTLAFIEAVARTLDLPIPLFASDLIRLCNQKLLPFYDAHKSLPENFKLNYMDRLGLQRQRPPTPDQVTKTACLLLHKIYEDRLPFRAPTPKLDSIYNRFIIDLNLPHDFKTLINNGLLDFSKFTRTRERDFKSLSTNRMYSLPQYDRWAFVFIICHLKRLFGCDESSMVEQEQKAKQEMAKTGEKVFVFKEWARQLSIKFRIVMKYDPYVLFSPVTNLRNLEASDLACQYIDTVVRDKVQIDIRDTVGTIDHDHKFRAEMSEFFDREIPRPAQCGLSSRHVDSEKNSLEDARHPLKDSILRTRKLWSSKLMEEPELLDLIWKEFHLHKVPIFVETVRWSIYDHQLPHLNQYEIDQSWPYVFKLLIMVGCFICQCGPQEIVRHIISVEEYLYPETKRMRRIMLTKAGVRIRGGIAVPLCN